MSPPQNLQTETRKSRPGPRFPHLLHLRLPQSHQLKIGITPIPPRPNTSKEGRARHSQSLAPRGRLLSSPLHRTSRRSVLLKKNSSSKLGIQFRHSSRLANDHHSALAASKLYSLTAETNGVLALDFIGSKRRAMIRLKTRDY